MLFVSIIAVGQNNKRMLSEQNKTSQSNIDDVKGIWVSYITLDMQNTDKSKEAFTSKINSIISKTKQSGFNTLIFQVRPFCDAIYKSEYYPWSHILSGTQGKNPEYDPLQIICDLCHENDISVHAWINPYRVKTKDTPEALHENNPYYIDNSIGFVHNDAIYLDPSDKKAQQLIVDGVTEIIENYDVDGIQFDDYFYPTDSDGVDDIKYTAYKESTDNPLSKEMWRAENVNTLIKKVYECVHNHSDEIVFGISPQGNINNNIIIGADVKKWCSTQGYIDYICPQIYFSLDNPSLAFEDSLNEWLNIPKHNNLKMYIGLAGYKGGTNEDEGTWLDNDDILKNEIEICKEKNTDGIMMYSYESFISEKNQKEIQNVVAYLNDIKE